MRVAKGVGRATAALRAASEERSLKRALLADRLNHVTGYGFGVLPAPLPLDAVDEREVSKICMAISKIDPRPEVVIAGFAGAPHLGLLRASLGEVKSTDNGSLKWSYLDDLPLPPPVIPRPRRLQFP